MEYIAIMLCQPVCWISAFSFTGAKWKRSVPAAAAAGLASAALLFLSYSAGVSGEYGFVLSMLVSDILMMLFFERITGSAGSYAPFAFLSALGTGLLLAACQREGVWLFLAACAAMLTAGLLFNGEKIPPHWHETADKQSKKGGLLPEAACLCFVMLSLGYWFVTWSTVWERWFSAALMMCVFICGKAMVVMYLNKKKTDAMASEDAIYRKEMETYLNVIRSQRHDYNFHVRTLARMLNDGNLTEGRQYVQELIDDSNAMNEVLPIRDPAIAATIYNFRTLAGREGITLHIDVQNDLSHISTNVYETTKIISNLLQNAIDEVKTHEDRSYGIWLYLIKRGQFCIIHTANEVRADMTPQFFEKIYQRGYTTKQGHEGVGLSSISSLAAHNNGVVYSRLEGNILHFVAKIPLKYEAVDEDEYRREK